MRTLSGLEIAPSSSYPRSPAASESSPLSSGGPESSSTTVPSSPSTLSYSGLSSSSSSSLVTLPINGEHSTSRGRSTRSGRGDLEPKVECAYRMSCSAVDTFRRSWKPLSVRRVMRGVSSLDAS